ncbi:hypothetical protein FRC04_008519 [Tulasnella sp. 424]|nr:hypothetical protein FRC04_008519 [Tulasnella sp. 424]
MLNPKQPLNATYAFQKVFSDGEFVAGGVLEIPVGGKQPSKPARDNTYEINTISKASPTMTASCSSHKHEVTETMIPSPTKRASMVPAGRDASASQMPRPAARVGPPAGSGSPSKMKKVGTSSKR